MRHVNVEHIRLGDRVQYAGTVTERLDGGAQVRLSFASGADAYFTKGTTLVIERDHGTTSSGAGTDE